jgi:class 3 adenylate cyclase/tetratricopeptide (TPR) repeat protein
MGLFDEWLQSIGLEQYSETFHENSIDLDVVGSLDDNDLRELGVKLGDRKRILAAGKALELADTSIRSLPTPSTSEAGRRQLTVMFCDLVGSTELSQKLDPEALRELMRAYQQTCGQLIDKYEGHVAQYLGDGLMVYFGWPQAHEDDAERAIRAGLDIVETVKHVPAPAPLHVRVGIATGPVVVGETGSGDASVPKVAVGETPNVAARIQGLAQADQIIIGPDTRRLVGGTFEVNDYGQHVLKGIVEPVRAWRVTGVARSEGRFDAAHGGSGLTPLVGREQELGLLMERWQLAQDGEGQVVLLSGEAGIGKSRILNALREKLEREGAKIMRFECPPYYVNSAFWPNINNFERTLKFARDETSDSKLDKLEALMVDRYQRPLADVRFIATMLSIPCEDRYGPLAITPQKFKDETLRTLVDLTEAAARKHSSALLFEDLHWSDPSTLEVLDLMIDRVKDIPLLIVLTHRPEFQSRWSDHGHVTSLNLSKLTRAQATAMVSGVTGGKSLPDDLLAQILAKTDGVPLFVEELTKSILESGELKEAGERYDYSGSVHSVTIPASLRDSLMARLDRHSAAREIAQVSAAIGREFSYELISAVTPMTQAQLDEALVQLTASGLAFRRGTPPDATYTFKHALIRDAAYDSLLKSRRQELHGKIAQALEAHFSSIKQTEPALLAHHLTEAGNAEGAIPLWHKAGELAIKRMALSEAISYLDQGLELITTVAHSGERDASELALRTLLGTAWRALKGWAAPEVAKSVGPALALAKSLKRDDTLAPIYMALFLNVLANGRVAESLSWLNEMLDTANETGNEALLITAHFAATEAHLRMGRLNEALKHHDKVLTLYDDERHRYLVEILNQDPKTSVVGDASIGIWMLGYPDRALQMCDEAVAHARKRAHPFDLGWALTCAADVSDLRGEPERSRRYAEECERLGRDNSLPILNGLLAPTRLGVAAIREGRFAEGISLCKQAGTVWRAYSGKAYAYGGAVLAEATARAGDLDTALQHIDNKLQQVERPGWEERGHYAEILRIKGWMLSLKGDLEGAEKNYLASHDWAREQQAKSWELRTSTSLAKLWQEQGKRHEAHELLAPVYGWFTEGFDTKDLKQAKALLDKLAA